MILSDDGIRRALASGELVIDPAPADDQYTTSSVDLTLGSVFNVWDKSRLDLPGVRVELDLADQKFAQTSNAYIVQAALDATGCCILPPYHNEPGLLLAITRERIHLVPGVAFISYLQKDGGRVTREVFEANVAAVDKFPALFGCRFSGSLLLW